MIMVVVWASPVNQSHGKVQAFRPMLYKHTYKHKKEREGGGRKKGKKEKK